MHIYLSELGPECIPEIIHGKGVLPSLLCLFAPETWTLIQAKSRNTHGDYSIQGKQHQDQEWRISWQITISNGWVREQQPLTNTAWTLVSPGKPVIPYPCPAASFTQSLLFSVTCLQPGPAFPPSLQGALVCATRVCVCVCTCTLWLQGSQIAPVGDQELVQAFWSDFARLGQSCVNSVCSGGWRLFSPGPGFQDPPPHHKQCHLSVQVAFFFPFLFINAKVSWVALTVFPHSRVESGHVRSQALWKNPAELMMTSIVQ